MFNVIPHQVCSDTNLVPGAILLYGNILTFTNNNRIVFGSNQYFAKFYGVTTRTIQRWLELLKENEYITISYEDVETETTTYERRIIKATPKGFDPNNTRPEDLMRELSYSLYSNTGIEKKTSKTTNIKELKKIWE